MTDDQLAQILAQFAQVIALQQAEVLAVKWLYLAVCAVTFGVLVVAFRRR